MALMIAMLAADNSVETLTKAAEREVGVQEPKQDSLHDHLAALMAARPALQGATEIAAIRKLRKARNTVQHDGYVPAAGIVAAFIGEAQGFARLVTKECFGRNFDDVSIVAFVADDQLRDMLEQADTHRRKGEIVASFVAACLAFELLYYRWIFGYLTDHGLDGDTIKRRLPGSGSALLARRGILAMKPKLANDRYTGPAEASFGFSAGQLSRLQGCVELAEAVDAAPEEFADDVRISETAVIWIINTVAWSIWRLEAENPGAVGRTEDALIWVAESGDETPVSPQIEHAPDEKTSPDE